MAYDSPGLDINTIDFEDNPDLADPDGHYFDSEDMYIDRDESYMIANLRADHSKQKKQPQYGCGGGSSSFWSLKRVLITLAIIWGFGTLCRIVLFLVALIMAI